jgi:hypothetical protein
MNSLSKDHKTLNGDAYNQTSTAPTTTSPPNDSAFWLRYLSSLAAALLSLILWYMRRTNAEVLGWKVGMVWGTIPVECFVCGVLIGWMAWEEMKRMEKGWREMGK